MVTRHLQNRHKYRYIIGSVEELTALIEEILGVNQQQQLRIESPEVADQEQHIAELIVPDDLHRIAPGVPHMGARGQKIAVHDPFVLIIKPVVEQLEHESPKQVIVTINHHEYLLRLTEIVGGVQDISQCHLPLLVPLDLEPPLPVHLVSLHILLDCPAGIIAGCVIDDDHPVVLVFLPENGVHVFSVPSLGHIVISGHHHTYRFLLIRVHIVVFLKLVLLLHQVYRINRFAEIQQHHPRPHVLLQRNVGRESSGFPAVVVQDIIPQVVLPDGLFLGDRMARWLHAEDFSVAGNRCLWGFLGGRCGGGGGMGGEETVPNEQQAEEEQGAQDKRNCKFVFVVGERQCRMIGKFDFIWND